MKLCAGKKSKGLSLSEVIVALFILSLGILGIMGIFPVMFRSIHHSWITSEAMTVAQQTLDRLIVTNAFVNTEHTTVNPAPPQIPRDRDGNPQGFVEYWGDTPQPAILPRTQVIHVRVTWTENSQTRTYEISGAVMP